MSLFQSSLELLRRLFFKQKFYDPEKPGISLQDQDGITKLERNTGTAAKSESGNDIDTQIHPHAAAKPSWTSIICRMGVVECKDCARHRALTDKRDEHQDRATSGLTSLASLGQKLVGKIGREAYDRHEDEELYYLLLAPVLPTLMIPSEYTSARLLSMCYDN
jgi:hypothetical protein